jgi:hypothetical protein
VTLHTDGRIFVAWDGVVSGTRRIFVRERTAGGTWQPAVQFSHLTHQAQSPSVGIDYSNGKINLVWKCGTHIARASRLLSGGSWSAINDHGSGAYPTVPAEEYASFLPGTWTTGTTTPYSLSVTDFYKPGAPRNLTAGSVVINNKRRPRLGWTIYSEADLRNHKIYRRFLYAAGEITPWELVATVPKDSSGWTDMSVEVQQVPKGMEVDGNFA